jgi:hypothetical protein
LILRITNCKKKYKMKRKTGISPEVILIVIIGLLVITGSARREDIELCLKGHTYGFFGGLWHGFIAPFDFVAMLFNEKITMYAQNNNGGLYALGFLLGSGGWGFFGGKGVKRVQHTRVNIQNERFDKAEVIE